MIWASEVHRWPVLPHLPTSHRITCMDTVTCKGTRNECGCISKMLLQNVWSQQQKRKAGCIYLELEETCGDRWRHGSIIQFSKALNKEEKGNSMETWYGWRVQQIETKWHGASQNPQWTNGGWQMLFVWETSSSAWTCAWMVTSSALTNTYVTLWEDSENCHIENPLKSTCKHIQKHAKDMQEVCKHLQQNLLVTPCLEVRQRQAFGRCERMSTLAIIQHCP